MYIAFKECKEALDQSHKRLAAVWMRLLCQCVRKLPLSSVSVALHTYPWRCPLFQSRSIACLRPRLWDHNKLHSGLHWTHLMDILIARQRRLSLRLSSLKSPQAKRNASSSEQHREKKSSERKCTGKTVYYHIMELISLSRQYPMFLHLID